MNRLILFIGAFFLLFAFSCSQKEPVEEKEAIVDSIINMSAWVYDSRMDKDASYRKLVKILAEQPNLSIRPKFNIYGSLCYYHFYKKDLNKALLYADSMVLVLQKSNEPDKYLRELAQGYYSKGDILFYLGSYDESYQNYYRAKEIISSNQDNCLSSDYSYRIGMVLYRQAKYAEACYFFTTGYSEGSSCVQNFAQIYRQQELLNNAALCYSKQNKIDSALIAYNRALAYINQNDIIADKKTFFSIARGVVYGNIGTEYFKQKQYQKAEEFLIKSIEINDKPYFENNDAALTQIKLGKLYLETNNLPKAVKLLAKLEIALKKINLPEANRDYQFLMSTYLGRIGRTAEAYAYLSRYVLMTDSIQRQLDKMRSSNINERFRNLDSQTEIGLLKRETELKDIYLYLSIVFVLMTLAIVLLIYFNWKKSRNNVKKLTELNNEIFLQKQKLEDTLQNLEISNKEKDSILRAVAHDLRNPIGGISSLVNMIMEDGEEDDESLLKHQLIRETCDNTLKLINELIEASENQNTQQIIDHRSITNLVEVVNNAIELLNFKAQEKQQYIQFEMPVKPILISINKEKIFRVVSNLISNAIKFSEENKTIEVILSQKKEEILVEVIDHGIGIPLHMQDKIFQVFTAAKREGTNGEKSYGLGLSICKQIIEAHGGKLNYRPNKTRGSNFLFSLPLDQ